MTRSEPSASDAVFDLERLRFADAVAIGQALRLCGATAALQSEAAQRVVDYLYEILREPATGLHCCPLVRVFQTQPYANLPAGAQDAARRSLHGATAMEGLRCLALLATRGDEATWNRPEDSAAHRAIPLPDVAMVEQAPMIARLLAQLGLEAGDVVQPRSAILLDAPQRSFNVFHVEEAAGSEYLPAQQTFVARYGIRSVVGMGGLLPSGELFAVILFARVHISREVAELFRTLALSVKLAFLPFGPDQVFSDCYGLDR